jgi:hypothetical protein
MCNPFQKVSGIISECDREAAQEQQRGLDLRHPSVHGRMWNNLAVNLTVASPHGSWFLVACASATVLVRLILIWRNIFDSRSVRGLDGQNEDDHRNLILPAISLVDFRDTPACSA